MVDDGSRDATVRRAFDYVRKHGVDAVRVLQLPRNYGKVQLTSQYILWSIKRGREIVPSQNTAKWILSRVCAALLFASGSLRVLRQASAIHAVSPEHH